MGRYIVRRLVQTVPLLFLITIITFGIANLIPGSPVRQLQRQLDPRISEEDLARIEHNLGLDQPLYLRYFTWVSHVARGDLGISMKNYYPVSTLIRQRLPNTLLLTGAAFLLALLFAIPVGVYSAVHRNSWFDHVATAGAVAGYSIPTFWLGLMAIMLFAVRFQQWGLPSLPAGGAYDLVGGGGFWDRLVHLILPATTLAFVQAAYWTRFVRSQMLEVLNLDYMRTATAKGLRSRSVIYRHGLRNALLPLVTLMGLAIPDLFGGALIIEQIFAWPGMGRLAYRAALDHDYPLIMGTVLFASVIVILGNLVADVVYGLIDPRVRLE